MDCTLSTTNDKPGTALTCNLASEINAEHQACMQAAGKAIEHAMRAGDLLSEAKSKCQHGEWQEWLAQNFDASPRTARAYMRLAENRQTIEAKRQSVATLGVADAISLIAAPRLDRRHPRRSDDPGLLSSDPPAFDRMMDRHAVYRRNANAHVEEVTAFLERATVDDLPAMVDTSRELYRIVYGWTAYGFKIHAEIGRFMKEWDEQFGEGMGAAIMKFISTDEGHEEFQQILNAPIAELEEYQHEE